MSRRLPLGLLFRLTETWIRRPSSPVRAVLSLTRRCNLRCQTCRTWEVAPPAPELSADEVGRILRQMPRLTWLDVTGGEIFVRRDAEAVLDAVLDHTPSLRLLHFPTNGWHTERVVAAARQVRRRRPEVALLVTVSFDGPGALHDELRGRPGAFEHALATFRALRSEPGVKVYAGTTVSRANAAHLDALGAALARALDGFSVEGFSADEWHWNWMVLSGHYFRNEGQAALTMPQPERLVRDHIRRRGAPRSLVDVMELGFLVNLERYLGGEPTGVPCQALRSTCFVSPEGQLYPCHVWDRPLGDLRERPLAELWRSPEVLAARSEVERLDCGGCFTPCEAYPALAGAPVAASVQTLRRLGGLLRRSRKGTRS